MTPHEVLGIPPDATEDEAEEAYDRLLMIHHPDLHQGGTAEEIAAAEARTRALNVAMQRVRASFHQGAERTRDPIPDPVPPHAPPQPSRWDEPEPHRVAGCPFCGERFDDATAMRDHVEDRHDVRLEHRRRSRVGRGLDRFFGRWEHISVWHLAPLNAVAALLLAVLVLPLGTDFAYWVFGVAMAPTLILLLDRGAGAR